MVTLTKALWGAASKDGLPRWHEAGQECPELLIEEATAQDALEKPASKPKAGK